MLSKAICAKAAGASISPATSAGGARRTSSATLAIAPRRISARKRALNVACSGLGRTARRRMSRLRSSIVAAFARYGPRRAWQHIAAGDHIGMSGNSPRKQ
jgi:hypothetical protein